MIDPFLIIHLAILSFLAITINRRVRHHPLGSWYLPGLLVKLIAGLGVGAVYFFYYRGGDTIAYHEDGVRLARAFYEETGAYIQILLYNSQANDIWDSLALADQPRALLMAKIVSVVHILTDENYWLTSLYFSFFTFNGLWTLADKLSAYFPWTKSASVVAFLLFPSVVFWSSGITKESVAIGMLSWIVAIYLPLFAKGSIIHKRNVLLSLFMLLILWTLKYYYAAVLIAILGPTLIVGFFKERQVGMHWTFRRQLGYWVSFLVWFVVLASFIHPNLRLTEILDVVVTNHDAFVRMSSPENTVVFKNLEPRMGSFIRNLPTAWFAGLFRPLPGELQHLPGRIIGWENLFVMLFSGLSLVSILRFNRSNNGILVLGVCTYILLLAAFLTFSTPNLGTLARYKVGFLPFLVYIILADPPTRRISRLFRKKPEQ